MEKNIIIIGPQGSGKGAQAEILVKNFKLAYFSMGDELRRISEEDSLLGKNIKLKMEKGELIDDETIMQVFSKWLEGNQNNQFILDGIPRTLEQLKLLDELLGQKNIKPLVLYLNISKDTAIKRLSTRKVCQSCRSIYGPFSSGYNENKCAKCQGDLVRRSDETPEAIEKRLQEYYNKTKPVIDFYKNSGQLIEINGEPPVPEVTKEIMEKLK